MYLEIFEGPPHFGRLPLWNCGGPSSLLGVAAGPCEAGPGPSHPPEKCNLYGGVVFLIFLHCCWGTSSPLELSMEELRCRFLGVVEGYETVDEVAAGEGLAGDALCNDPGLLGRWRGDREGPGWEVDLRCWPSRFLNSISCSNFSQAGLNDLTLEVGCLGGVLGGFS